MEQKQSAFQTPVTISEVIQGVYTKKYLLPAIQREFVWSPEQIIKLFDSLLLGYPIGSFLFWSLEKKRIKEFQFYEFVRNFHERDNKHNPKANVEEDEDITVILDGQQRLTALFIALKGTYSYKMPWKQWRSDEAFPKRKLYLNLFSENSEEDLTYKLEFLTDDESKIQSEDCFWFEVGKILNLKDEVDVNDYLVENEIMTKDKKMGKCANKILFRLHSVIHKDRIINYYLENSQELHKVLNIFIRVNSGGTPLSYSDLLLSIATAQWKTLDAREVINEFVDDLNRIGDGFDFDKDFILKCCLVLADISDIAFKVDNFINKNMDVIEKKWSVIEKAIRLAVELVSSYGYTGETLTSTNAIIPIAYYILKLDNPAGFILSAKYNEDRKKIQKWLAIILIKRVFSGQPDNILRPIRQILQEHLSGFPYEKITEKFKGTSKSLSLSEDEISNLLFSQYGKAQTYSVLTLLYPTLDFRNRFHVDHIWPKSWFKKKILRKKGIAEEKNELYIDCCNFVANLQLLEGLPNVEKRDMDFNLWVKKMYTTETEKNEYMIKNYIPRNIEIEFSNFELFFSERHKLLYEKLKQIVNT